MKKKIFVIILILILLALSLVFKFSANSQTKNNIKIVATEEDFKKVYNEIYIKKNEEVIKSYNAIQKRANEILEEAVCKYEIDEGGRMLDVSRKCKETIEILGFTTKMMRLNNEEDEALKYANRAIQELVNVSNFQDWHPKHFLDVAEMTYSVSLGYIWFYDDLSPKERNVIENAIINNALIPSITVTYTNQFVNEKSNWNPICNGSLGISAIALLNVNRYVEINKSRIDYNFEKKYLKMDRTKIIDDKYKFSLNDFCNAIIERTVDCLPLVYEQMEDGSYEEGTLYWEYGNSYLVNFLATANLNFGTTFGLIKEEYLKNTILYPVYLTGKSSNDLPNCKLYNYGDADEYIVNTSASTWLANMYYQDEKLSQIINWYQENYFSVQNIYQLLWQNYDFSLNNVSNEERKSILNSINDKKYRGTEIAILQKSMLDKQGFYIATKAGKNVSTSHSDLDEGSFILDAKGTRWIEDLGREDYNVYRYWDKLHMRWLYYKKRAESHSCIILENGNVEDQKIDANCKIVNFFSNSEKSSVAIDISDAYNFGKKDKNVVTRKITLDKVNNEVEIEDTINLQKENNITSMFNVSKGTKITLENNNRVAKLERNVLKEDGTYKKETLKLELADEKYKWSILPQKPMEPKLIDISANLDYKRNLEYEKEEKLCIKIENGKNEQIKIRIY